MSSNARRPRVKPIYPVYRLDADTFRIGAQRGITTQFRDPRGHLTALLRLADGTRDMSAIRATMLAQFPDLSVADVDTAIDRLDRAGTAGRRLIRYRSRHRHRYRLRIRHRCRHLR